MTTWYFTNSGMRFNEQIEIRWQIKNLGQNYTRLFLKGRPGNNFVSFRPQVLRKKVSVTHDSDCGFSSLLFFFVCHIWQASWKSNLDKGGPSIEIVIKLANDSSANLFLRVIFVKFWLLKSVLILGCIFLCPHLTRQRKFYAAFFSKLQKSHKAAHWNKPCCQWADGRWNLRPGRKKITMNCQHSKTITSQINWIGNINFSFPLTMLVYLTFVSTNQLFPLKNTTGRYLAEFAGT